MKPWIVINAQNRVIGRYSTEEEAAYVHRDKGSLITIQYRPRAKKRAARTFP
jgi:hypothetical protein